MEEITIYKFQLESIRETLRVVANTYDCRWQQTCMDRMVTEAEKYAENALKGEIDTEVNWMEKPQGVEKINKTQNTLFFIGDNLSKEVLKICPNGDIFVKGKLIENEKEVVDAFREFLTFHGFIKQK